MTTVSGADLDALNPSTTGSLNSAMAVIMLLISHNLYVDVYSMVAKPRFTS